MSQALRKLQRPSQNRLYGDLHQSDPAMKIGVMYGSPETDDGVIGVESFYMLIRLEYSPHRRDQKPRDGSCG